MNSQLEKLGMISAEIGNAASKRRKISKILKLSGFSSIGKGAWLGFCGADLVSGLLIEGGASNVFISSFVLPVFDEIRFVNWSLGRRLVNCSADRGAEDETSSAVSVYLNEIFCIRSPSDLIGYIDSRQIDGFYPIWAKFICYLRLGCLEEARLYLTDKRIALLHHTLMDRLRLILPSAENGDAVAVEARLKDWEGCSRKLFGEERLLLHCSSSPTEN